MSSTAKNNAQVVNEPPVDVGVTTTPNAQAVADPEKGKVSDATAPQKENPSALEVATPIILAEKSWSQTTFADDKWFWMIIAILLVANIGIY